MDRRVVVNHFGLRGPGGFPHDASECADQIPDFQIGDRLVAGVDPPGREIVRHPLVALLPAVAHFVEDGGRVTNFLVLKQTFDQFLLRIGDFVFFGIVGDLWQHGLAFQFHQGAGQIDEISHVAEIQLLENFDVLEILVDDSRDRHFVQADFVTPDQVQQKVQRASVSRQINSK